MSTAATPDERHIAGILLQLRPASRDAVAAALAEWPGVEVGAGVPAGKLAVVCDCAGAGEVMERIAAMRELPGVLNVALVYQHAEDAAAMDEEMPS